MGKNQCRGRRVADDRQQPVIGNLWQVVGFGCDRFPSSYYIKVGSGEADAADDADVAEKKFTTDAHR